MFPFLTAIVGGIGSIFSGIFGLKDKQAEIISRGLDVIAAVDSTDAQRAEASSQIVVAEASSESWLARSWRPIFMWVCMAIVISFWFGYMPPHLNAPMPAMVAEIFDLLKIGMGGYIGGRSLEKIVSSLALGPVIKKFIEKKFS